MNPEVWIDPNPEPPVEAWRLSDGARKMAIGLAAFAVFLGLVVFLTREKPTSGPWNDEVRGASIDAARDECQITLDPESYVVLGEGEYQSVRWYAPYANDDGSRSYAEWHHRKNIQCGSE